MTQPTGSASRKAVEYALKLGLQDVYDETLTGEVNLNKAHNDLRTFTDKQRNLQELILDREAQVISDERAKNAEMSVTAFEKHIKLPLRHDPILQSYRAELLVTLNRKDEYEHRVKEMTEILRSRSARMMELGGYFHYLAAIRSESIKLDLHT